MINKEEFKHLYLNKGWNAEQLRKKYKVRTKTVLDLTHTITNENTRSLKNWQRKLTKYQVIKILIERMKYGTLNKDLAKKYSVSESRISSICNGHDWKHVFQGFRKKYNKEILSLKKIEL